MTEAQTLVAGRYRLIDRLAVGGMGMVWEAYDERLQRTVALKQLHPRTALPPGEAELAGDRAMREARITARLHHPHAVPVYDIVEHDGSPCLVMQFLPSTSLQQMLTEKGALAPPLVARWGSQIASALAAAHEAGIVHRDVKPGNILIAEDGSAKITDFGISHAMGDITLTSTGMVTGTPAFLAPEAARGAKSGFPADVFSLGATLYAAVEGVPPFGTESNPMAMLHRVASGQSDPPRRSGTLTPMLQRMLAADPAQRPPMRDVARQLAAIAAETDGRSAAATTEQLVAAPTQAPPPAPVPPAAFDTVLAAPPGGRPRRRRWPLVAALVVAAAVIATVLVLINSNGDGTNPGAHTTGPPRSAATSPAASQQASQSAAQPTSQAASQSASPPAAAAPGELAAAIPHYYGLLPNDTDAAWQLLTPSFQSGRAGGRATYDAYWGSMRSVSVKDVQATPPGTVVATVVYVYDDGHTVSERTTFGLMQDGGVWKIKSQG
jgi:serine/threonine protein kinase